MRIVLLIVVGAAWLLPASILYGHGGGFDAHGCHHDRKRGGYHCHRGPLAGQDFAGKAEAQAVLRGGAAAPRPAPPMPAAPPIVATIVPYDRSLYGGWIDADGDCQDTRQEVLIEESLVPVQLDAAGCRVLSGRWLDPYTGQIFTNPRDLDVDHLVPLAEAHRSGADAWSPEQRRDFANELADPDHLVAVAVGANRSKSDQDPAQWMPENTAYHCAYVRAWVGVKQRWGLRADASETIVIKAVLRGCERR